MSVERYKVGASIKGMPILIYIKAWKLSTTPNVQTHVFFQGVLDGPKGKRLQMRIPDSTWRQEMTFQKTAVLQKYREACTKLGLDNHWLPIDCHIVA